MKIGNINTKNNYFLAPMAGFSDVAFRQICAQAGAGLTTTEMVSAKGLIYGVENSMDLLATSIEEKISCVQLFGNEIGIMADAVQLPVLQKFDIIDINMGCPVPKIVKNGMGSALLRNPPLAGKIIESAVLNSKKPITVKMRIGWDTKANAVDFAKLVQDSGASALCVHGRTKEEMYSGVADWETISKIANSITIPVIGNGDINSCEMANLRLSQSGVSAVSIGRGALGNPWLFAQLTNTNFTQNKLAIIIQQYKKMCEFLPATVVLTNMRKHICFYVKEQRGSKVIRDKINRSNDLNEIIELLQKLFE